MALDLSTGILGLTDENVKISSTDSTAGKLFNKVFSSDNSVTFSTVGAAGTNQTLDIKSVGGGEVNTGSNVGAGTGLVFKTKVGVQLRFKSLIGGTNVTVTNNTDDITIDASGSADGNGIFDAANDAGGATIPAAFDAQMTDTFKLTGGKFGVDVTPTAKFQVKGDGSTTGVMVLFENDVGTDKFTMLDDGSVVLAGSILPQLHLSAINAQIKVGAASPTVTTFLNIDAAHSVPYFTWGTIANPFLALMGRVKGAGQIITGSVTGDFGYRTDVDHLWGNNAGNLRMRLTAAGALTLVTGDLDVASGIYRAGGTAGLASFTGAVTNITIKNGIVTAAS